MQCNDKPNTALGAIIYSPPIIPIDLKKMILYKGKFVTEALRH